jgi:hypothetical protein
MKLISHRGNINGPNPKHENDPFYIKEALDAGYDCEIDLWFTLPEGFVLGHDEPQYKVNRQFLQDHSLWIHCKNYEALRELIPVPQIFNFFYHTDEDYVLTSQGYIWAYPGKPGTTKTVCVMPEYYDTPVEGYWGVCSDYVEKYRD